MGDPPQPGPRTLWLVRHAKALADPPFGGTDHERPLSSRGRRDAAALGRRLGPAGDHLGLAADPPTAALSSTASRAARDRRRRRAPLGAIHCRRAETLVVRGASPRKS